MRENILISNPEFLLCQMHDGVSIQKNAAAHSVITDFSDLQQATVSTYFLDHDDHHIGINTAGLIIADFNSAKDAIGKTIASTMQHKTYLDLHNQNQMVMHTKSNFNKEHEFINRLGQHASCIDYKFPWYDNEGKLLGIFGMVLVYSSDYCEVAPLKSSIDFIIKMLSRMNQQKVVPLTYELGNIKLTRREKDCAALLIKGLTAKAIAKELNLSYRTVEYYLENLKAKFDVSTKTALATRLIEIIN